MIKLILPVVLLLLSSCTHKPELTQSDTSGFEKGQQFLANAKYAEAIKAFDAYLASSPQSQLLESTFLGRAQALEGLGDYANAVATYRDIARRTAQKFPDIAAQALYRSSFSYEALGNEEQAISSLLDAQRLKRHLPVEVAEAEVPSRLGLLYAKIGQNEQARIFNQQAFDGIERVKEVKTTKDWLARTYYQMGLSSDNQISADSLERHMEALKWAQVYLIKAIKMEQAPWAERAYLHLREIYVNVLGQLEGLSQSDLIELRGGELLALIRQAELYRPLEAPQGFEASFYKDLAEIQKRADRAILGKSLKTPVTLESQILQGIKREGRVKPDSLLPEEKISPISSP